jgi:hypothetical protein
MCVFLSTFYFSIAAWSKLVPLKTNGSAAIFRGCSKTCRLAETFNVNRFEKKNLQVMATQTKHNEII